MKKKLYVVTNRNLVRNGTLIDKVSSAVKGGADGIILREKYLEDSLLYVLAVSLAEVVRDIPLIINGNFKVAQETEASGVHLNYDAFMNFNNTYAGLKGVSVHSLEEAIRVEQKGADYVIAGHIFNTACKQGMEGRGTKFLRDISSNLRIPVIAIGGITEDNVKRVLDSGADGIAVMSSVMQAENPEQIVYNLKNAMEKF